MSHGKTNPAHCSPHGWWVATLLERFQPYDENPSDEERPCYAHENVVLIKSADREEAYRKAVEIGEASHGTEWSDAENVRRGTWVFEGLMSLLPVYEELQDGAELIWTEHTDVSLRRLRSWVRAKEDLEAFLGKEE